jgi:formate-dependent phosphoribosylglycinamide formyltransferase (GAR transformylase)
MKHAVFVAPFAMATTLRFIRAVATLPDVRLSLVTQEPAEKLPDDLRATIAGHWRVADGLDADQLEQGVRALAKAVAPVDCLLGTLEQLQVQLAQARARLGLRGLSVDAAENFRDKARMKTALRNAGLPCARHKLVATKEAALKFGVEIGYPIVVKPPAGAGAKATFRVDDAAAMAAAIDASRPSVGNEVLLEEFMVGEEHSFDAVCIRGRPVWHSLSRYTPTPLEVLRNPWIQWCVMIPRDIDAPKWDDVRRVGFRALEVLGQGTGVSHMEWFRKKNGGVAVSEIAARPPGAQFCTLISYAHDFDFYKAWARLVVFEEFEPPQRKFAAGAAYLRGQGEGDRVAAVHGLDVLARELGELVVEAKLPRAGQGPSGSYEGEGYIVVRHPETEVVEKALARIVSVARVEMA